MYLDDGWKEFVKDHSLKEAYFLVFKYLGNMHFAVKIFDGTHCEIEDACNVKMKEDPGSCKEEKQYYDYEDSLYPHTSLTKQAPGNSPKKMQLKYSSTRGKNNYAKIIMFLTNPVKIDLLLICFLAKKVG